MRLITANVNGIRAAVRRGALAWLEEAAADVITFQETRADLAQLTKALAGSPFASWQILLGESSTAGRAGVAILVRPGLEIGEPTRGLAAPGDEAFTDLAAQTASGHAGADASGWVFAQSGRWIEVSVRGPASQVTVASAYAHSGDAARPEVQAEKYALLLAMTHRLRRAHERGEHLVVTGDLNVAHHEVDIKNWKGNRGKAGFLPEERAYLDLWRDERLVVDVGRTCSGDGPGPYTWWSWRGKAFDNDAGWRIDYHLATPALAATVTGHQVGRASSYDARWSDHAAVVVDYDLAAVTDVAQR